MINKLQNGIQQLKNNPLQTAGKVVNKTKSLAAKTISKPAADGGRELSGKRMAATALALGVAAPTAAGMALVNANQGVNLDEQAPKQEQVQKQATPAQEITGETPIAGEEVVQELPTNQVAAEMSSDELFSAYAGYTIEYNSQYACEEKGGIEIPLVPTSDSSKDKGVKYTTAKDSDEFLISEQFRNDFITAGGKIEKFEGQDAGHGMIIVTAKTIRDFNELCYEEEITEESGGGNPGEPTGETVIITGGGTPKTPGFRLPSFEIPGFGTPETNPNTPETTPTNPEVNVTATPGFSGSFPGGGTGSGGGSSGGGDATLGGGLAGLGSLLGGILSSGDNDKDTTIVNNIPAAPSSESQAPSITNTNIAGGSTAVSGGSTSVAQGGESVNTNVNANKANAEVDFDAILKDLNVANNNAENTLVNTNSALLKQVNNQKVQSSKIERILAGGDTAHAIKNGANPAKVPEGGTIPGLLTIAALGAAAKAKAGQK